LEDHCQAHGIVDPEERKRVAIRIMFLFESGTETVDELAAALDYSARDDRREA
jgi:hypothetical protein